MMSMLDDSENEDMTRFLEAADTNLLKDELFKSNTTGQTIPDGIKNKTNTALGCGALQTQRYLSETDTITGADTSIPDAVQKHIAKKLSELIHNNVEFYDCTHKESSIEVPKSRVRLLLGFDCYVQSYKEFEYDTKGPSKKPNIKRRRLPDQMVPTEAEKIISSVISSEYILNGSDLQSWAVKKDRNNKVFHYYLADNNTLHAKETITEFTLKRRKNKWNASKIKRT